MEFKLVLLWCITLLIFLNAEVVNKANEDNIYLAVMKLNQKINIDGIDTYKLRMEYQDIFTELKQLKLKRDMSRISFVYISLAQGISNLKLWNISALLKREILDKMLVDEIDEALDSSIFSQKIQTELLLALEKELLLTKEPLLITVQNNSKNMLERAKKNLLKQKLTKKELESGIYLNDSDSIASNSSTIYSFIIS